MLLIGLFDRRSGESAHGLTVLRTIWLSLLIALFLYLLVLSFIATGWSGGAGWYPVLVVTIGIAALLWQRRVTSKPLDGKTPETVRRSYQQMFFRGFAAAELPALVGFVGVFVTERIWIYLLGMAFAVPGMILIAPSRYNLERHQRSLREQGSALSIVDVLARSGAPT
jgi:hypothetical protein